MMRVKKTHWKCLIHIAPVLFILSGSIVAFYQHSRNFFWLWLLPGVFFTFGWIMLGYLYLFRRKFRTKIKLKKDWNIKMVIVILMVLAITHSLLIRWWGRSFYEHTLTEGPTITITARVVGITSRFAYRWERKSWAIVEYKVDNKLFKKPIRNYNDEFEVGQQINLLISSDHPKILKIIQ